MKNLLKSKISVTRLKENSSQVKEMLKFLIQIDHYLPMTGQMSCTNDKVKRTKFFFGARYIWSRQQLSDPHSMVAAGIRVDVSEPPKWTKDLVEHPMVEEGIIPKVFQCF
jgi:hypothetical protein